jgi:hypothetical protein
MRPNAVVMAQIINQHLVQAAPMPDQYPIQTLRPNRRNLQNLDTSLGEHSIKRGSESRVPVADQEPKPIRLVGQPMSRFRACCATHIPVGCAVIPAR